MPTPIRSTGFVELASQLKELERRRQANGLALNEARLWRDLYRELLHRLMSSGSPGERREALRVPCELEIGGQNGAWTASNFGPGGLCVTGHVVPLVGAEVPLEWVALAGRRRKLGVRARVAWSQERTAGLEIQNDDRRFKLVESLYSVLLDAFLHEV